QLGIEVARFGGVEREHGYGRPGAPQWHAGDRGKAKAARAGVPWGKAGLGDEVIAHDRAVLPHRRAAEAPALGQRRIDRDARVDQVARRGAGVGAGIEPVGAGPRQPHGSEPHSAELHHDVADTLVQVALVLELRGGLVRRAEGGVHLAHATGLCDRFFALAEIPERQLGGAAHAVISAGNSRARSCVRSDTKPSLPTRPTAPASIAAAAASGERNSVIATTAGAAGSAATRRSSSRPRAGAAPRSRSRMSGVEDLTNVSACALACT